MKENPHTPNNMKLRTILAGLSKKNKNERPTLTLIDNYLEMTYLNYSNEMTDFTFGKEQIDSLASSLIPKKAQSIQEGRQLDSGFDAVGTEAITPVASANSSFWNSGRRTDAAQQEQKKSCPFPQRPMLDALRF